MRPAHPRPLALPLALALALLLPAAPLGAQTEPGRERISERPSFYLGLNALIGGASAMTRAHLRGADRSDAFLKGAGGGVLMHAGQRLVGTGEAPLRVVGIQTVALGANLARNAGDGVPLLSDLIVPVYPFYLRVRGADAGRPKLTVRVSAMNVTGILKYSTRWDGRLDLPATLSTGAPVFRSPHRYVDCAGAADPVCGQRRNGQAMGGALIYTADRSPEEVHRILTHEAGHVAQFTRDAILHAAPLSEPALRAGARTLQLDDRAASAVSDWLVLDFLLPLHALRLLSEPIDRNPGSDNLLEREADAMMGIDLCERRGYSCTW